MFSKRFAFALATPVVLVLLGVALADKADDNFAACCEKEGVDKDCCKYRRPSVLLSDSFAALSVGCLTPEGFPKFAKCAAGGQDNTDCCKNKKNVTNPLCLELCNGAKPISHNNPTDYALCSDDRGKIVECNHDANNH
ncbi:hypothetical protein AAVH_25455 [Aphelenchoides avenae]|nr:hypothetical protein AAVH_25455 [Aphelenchus avenae]